MVLYIASIFYNFCKLDNEFNIEAIMWYNSAQTRFGNSKLKNTRVRRRFVPGSNDNIFSFQSFVVPDWKC